MPATKRKGGKKTTVAAAPASSSGGTSKSKKKQQQQAKTKPQAPSVDLPRDAKVLVLSFLDSARDVGRCAQLSQAWRHASNASVIWCQLMEIHRPELAAAVLPIASRHSPPPDGNDTGRLDSWHPKRLLKQHWRTMRNRRGKNAVDDSSDEDEEGDDDGGWEAQNRARERKEARRWQARFRDCYLQVCLTDAADPKRSAVLTKVVPITDGDAMKRLFSTGGFGQHALCLGTMPACKEVAFRDEDWDWTVCEMLPERLAVTMSVLDWSGPEPRAAHLISEDEFEVDFFHNTRSQWQCWYMGQWGDSSINPNTRTDTLDYFHTIDLLPRWILLGEEENYFHTIDLLPRWILLGEEENYTKSENADRDAGCRAAVAKAGEEWEQAVHIHARINVRKCECEEVEEMNAFSAAESWAWLDSTWATLDWK